MNRLKDVRETHIPTYSRKRLGSGAISGRPLWSTQVKCSCGWSCSVNQPKAGAESDWKAHTRSEWDKQRNNHPDLQVENSAPTAPEHQGAWGDYLRWQERQKQVLPCPCCGADATWKLADGETGKNDRVQCKGCGLLVEGTGEIGSALEKWNRRT